MSTELPIAIGPRRTASRRQARPDKPLIPHYFLYGETEASVDDWIANVELLGERCRLSGWRISPHSHPNFGQMVYVRSGRGVIVVDDKATTFESPCVILVPVNSVHGFTYEQDTDGWVVTIAEYYLRHLNDRLPQFAALWSQPQVFALPRDGEDVGEIKAAILKLARELDRRESGYMVAAEVQLMSILLALLRRPTATPAEVETCAPSQARIVEDYRLLVERHYQHGWKIARFAAELGLSLAQLRAACDAVAGVGPLRMLQARILIEAKRNLIFSDMTVEQVAYWLGFSDPAYFARFFRKETGQPPAAFRRAMRREGAAQAIQP